MKRRYIEGPWNDCVDPYRELRAMDWRQHISDCMSAPIAEFCSMDGWVECRVTDHCNLFEYPWLWRVKETARSEEGAAKVGLLEGKE